MSRGSTHIPASDLAGKTVKIRADVPSYGGADYVVEDWFVNVSDGIPWKDASARGNIACIQYAARSHNRVPDDDRVLYGKIGPFGHLIHISEVAL